MNRDQCSIMASHIPRIATYLKMLSLFFARAYVLSLSGFSWQGFVGAADEARSDVGQKAPKPCPFTPYVNPSFKVHEINSY